MMKSSCCYADVKTERREELYHGCDDDYELMIPFQVCSKCGKIQLTVIETEDIKKKSLAGDRK